MDTRIINILTASTNIFGLLPYSYVKSRNIVLSRCILLVIMASIFMHLSETKHDLVGIYPLNQYSNLFLNIDRVTSISITTLILYWYYKYQIKLPIIGFIGIICLFISEHINNQIVFLLFHNLWHMLGYQGLYLVLYDLYGEYHITPSVKSVQ